MSITKLGFYIAVVLTAALTCKPVDAQQSAITLTFLITQGFEIKAAWNGGIVVQKGKDVFICLSLVSQKAWVPIAIPSSE
jgi:hypothetical protein